MNSQSTKNENHKHDNIYSNPVAVAPRSMSDAPSRVEETEENILRKPRNIPKEEGRKLAKSAVTGGPPEDMNMMPPAVNSSDVDELIYDGSSLAQPKHPTAKLKPR